MMEEEKENVLAKPALNHFFQHRFEIHRILIMEFCMLHCKNSVDINSNYLSLDLDSSIKNKTYKA